MITSTKLHVLVLTSSINKNIKFLEDLKQGFKRTVSQKKCRSEITTQAKNNNLDYMINPTYRNIHRLFVQLFKVGKNDPTRNPFVKYYIPLVEIKDFNALIDNKSFFDQPIKNKHKSYGRLSGMLRRDDYTTEKLLHYSYHQNYYKVNSLASIYQDKQNEYFSEN